MFFLLLLRLFHPSIHSLVPFIPRPSRHHSIRIYLSLRISCNFPLFSAARRLFPSIIIAPHPHPHHQHQFLSLWLWLPHFDEAISLLLIFVRVENNSLFFSSSFIPFHTFIHSFRHLFHFTGEKFTRFHWNVKIIYTNTQPEQQNRTERYRTE